MAWANPQWPGPNRGSRLNSWVWVLSPTRQIGMYRRSNELCFSSFHMSSPSRSKASYGAGCRVGAVEVIPPPSISWTVTHLCWADCCTDHVLIAEFYAHSTGHSMAFASGGTTRCSICVLRYVVVSSGLNTFVRCRAPGQTIHRRHSHDVCKSSW